MGARRHRRAAGGAVAGILIATVTLGADKPDEKPIAAGPTSISAEEAGIQADLAAGAQHGVILVEEGIRDESGGKFVFSYHLRAKILSPEGRKLGDLEIPVGKGRSALKTWWGRTILPDGRVLELPESALTEKTLAKSAKGRVGVRKGVLDGVEPGAVLDDGFAIQIPGVVPVDFVLLEREWPVRRLRYVWYPYRRLNASYASSHLEGRNVQVKSGEGKFVVTAANLTPVKDEPYSPPKRELQASVILYYGNSQDPRVFWDHEATGLDLGLSGFAKRPELQRLVAAMALPEGDSAQRLQAAYDWVDAHFVNADTFSAEELETNATGDEGETRLKLVIETRRGTSWQLAYVYAGVARAIGADAALVYAVDRTERSWNFSLTTRAQFEYLFVAVRPSGKPDAPWTVVQPASGMPFGELPWRATGGTALLCTVEGMKRLTLPPTLGPKNKSETHAKIAVGDDETIRGTWSRTALGASGMEPRRDLRRLDPSERKERLDSLCRGGETGEVLTASLPGLDEPRAPFRIECDVSTDASIAEHLDVYPLSLEGAWWPETPELTAATRTFPVIFDYPRLDVVALDVATPPGFSPGDPPPKIDVETPFGRYQWTAARTDAGFHVERSLSLLPLSVKPSDYDALKSFLKQVRAGDRTTLPFRRASGP